MWVWKAFGGVTPIPLLGLTVCRPFPSITIIKNPKQVKTSSLAGGLSFCFSKNLFPAKCIRLTIWPKSAASEGEVCRDAGRPSDPDENDIMSSAAQCVFFRWGQDLEATDLSHLGTLLRASIRPICRDKTHVNSYAKHIHNILASKNTKCLWANKCMRIHKSTKRPRQLSTFSHNLSFSVCQKWIHWGSFSKSNEETRNKIKRDHISTKKIGPLSFLKLSHKSRSLTTCSNSSLKTFYLTQICTNTESKMQEASF